MFKKQVLQILVNFMDVVKKMESLGMAHGDLSGGNILIESNLSIKLIDYDGMFIPDLKKNSPPRENGTSGYQHKNRLNDSIRIYDETMDRFSILVIYLSLLAISEKPALFEKYRDTDTILFNKRDIENPDSRNSFGDSIFNDLQLLSPEIVKLTKELKNWCKLNDFTKHPKILYRVTTPDNF